MIDLEAIKKRNKERHHENECASEGGLCYTHFDCKLDIDALIAEVEYLTATVDALHLQERAIGQSLSMLAQSIRDAREDTGGGKRHLPILCTGQKGPYRCGPHHWESDADAITKERL